MRKTVGCLAVLFFATFAMGAAPPPAKNVTRYVNPHSFKKHTFRDKYEGFMMTWELQHGPEASDEEG